jgi:hypothetical protein
MTPDLNDAISRQRAIELLDVGMNRELDNVARLGTRQTTKADIQDHPADHRHEQKELPGMTDTHDPKNGDAISRSQAIEALENERQEIGLGNPGYGLLNKAIGVLASLPVVPQPKLKCKNCGEEIHARGWTHTEFDTVFCAALNQSAEPAPVVAGELTPCLHENVQMLAHQDDIPPDGPCLVWSPICRDCGADVPAAAQ